MVTCHFSYDKIIHLYVPQVASVMMMMMMMMNCDVFTVSWKQLKVDGAEQTVVVIRHLDADEVYCVKMKSVSSLGDSRFTVPLKHRVFRTGNDVRVYFVLSNVILC